MRILMIAPTPFFADRGCHVRILGEAQALQERGHVVKICTYHLGKEIDGIETVRTPKVPWYRKLSAGPSIHKMYIDVLLLLKVLVVCRQFRPNVIHAHLHEGMVIGKLASVLYGIQLVADVQGSLTEELLDHQFIPRWSWLVHTVRWIEKKINEAPDHLIASSTQTANLVVKRFGCRTSRVTAIGDGVDGDMFYPQKPDEGLKRRLGISPQDRVVVFIGVLTSYQGINLLLEAVKPTLQMVPNVKFLLVGYPEDEYREEAKRMGLEKHTIFTGKIPYAEAAKYLALGHIAVSPKVSETEANLKLFSYMAMGLPTVVFNNPVNREILGDLGVYARSGDVGSLADAMATLLYDEGRMTYLMEKSSKKAADSYSWKAVAEQLEILYRRNAETRYRHNQTRGFAHE